MPHTADELKKENPWRGLAATKDSDFETTKYT